MGRFLPSRRLVDDKLHAIRVSDLTESSKSLRHRCVRLHDFTLIIYLPLILFTKC